MLASNEPTNAFQIVLTQFESSVDCLVWLAAS